MLHFTVVFVFPSTVAVTFSDPPTATSTVGYGKILTATPDFGKAPILIIVSRRPTSCQNKNECALAGQLFPSRLLKN